MAQPAIAKDCGRVVLGIISLKVVYRNLIWDFAGLQIRNPIVPRLSPDIEGDNALLLLATIHATEA